MVQAKHRKSMNQKQFLRELGRQSRWPLSALRAESSGPHGTSGAQLHLSTDAAQAPAQWKESFRVSQHYRDTPPQAPEKPFSRAILDSLLFSDPCFRSLGQLMKIKHDTNPELK